MQTAIFRIKCEPRSKWYYRVYVFDTRRTLVAFLDELSRRDGEYRSGRYRRTEGFCRWSGPLKRAPHCVGLIAMHSQTDRPVSVASHELAHAAMFYWTCTAHRKMRELDRKRKGTRHASRREERFCRISQELARTFWTGWQRMATSKRSRSSRANRSGTYKKKV